jgi:hypothetical protein
MNMHSRSVIPSAARDLLLGEAGKQIPRFAQDDKR